MWFKNKTKTVEPVEMKIDTKPFRKEMYHFFEKFDWPHHITITNIDVIEVDNKYVITITTHRPGLLIGQSGKFINALQAELRIVFNRPVDIRILEDTMWHNLYN